MLSMSGLSSWADGFLGDRDNPLRWTMTDAHEGFVLHSIFRGQGSDAGEVAVATTQTAPGVASAAQNDASDAGCAPDESRSVLLAFLLG